MISLTYLSSATRALSLPELEELLAQSRDHNEVVGLSGTLLYADEHFIQTLEGEEAAVHETLERIMVDPRHRHLVITLRDEVEKRTFPDWSMGCNVLTAAQIVSVPGWNDFLNPDSQLYDSVETFGRAGIFHRIFRNTMPDPTMARRPPVTRGEPGSA